MRAAADGRESSDPSLFLLPGAYDARLEKISNKKSLRKRQDMMQRIRHAILLVLLTAITATAHAEKGGDSGSRTSRKPTRRTSVTVDGVRLSYVPQRMPKGRMTTTRAKTLIRGLDATVTTTTAIGFGRRVLPPGSYVARVDGKSGKDHFLVISLATPRPSKPRQGAGKSAKRKTTSRESSAAARKPSRKNAPAAKPSRTKKDAAKTAPLVEIRARLRLEPSEREKPLQALSIELEVFATGTKLRVTIGAGSVDAVANLRFVDPSGKVKVESPKPKKATAKKKGTTRKRAAKGSKAKS